MRLAILILLLGGFGCAAKGAPAEFTNFTADETAIYAMMSANAYRRNVCDDSSVADEKCRRHFPIEKLGWKRVAVEGGEVSEDQNSYKPKTVFGRMFSNLQFDIWEDSASDLSVIAFKGTDEKTDWFASNLALGISIAYKSANKHIRLYREGNPERRVVVTGHSLGGGLALSGSVHNRNLDAYVFNSSPRIFDGLQDANEPAKRIAVFQRGEVLEKVRRRWKKFSEKVPEENVYETNFDYGSWNPHRADVLAEGILRCSTVPEFVALAELLPPKRVDCYLTP